MGPLFKCDSIFPYSHYNIAVESQPCSQHLLKAASNVSAQMIYYFIFYKAIE